MRLTAICQEVQKRKLLELAICTRAAQADQKGWKEFSAALGEAQKKGNSEDFRRAINEMQRRR